MYVKDIKGNFVPAVEKKNDGIFSTIESAAWMEDIDIDKKKANTSNNHLVPPKPTENLSKPSPPTTKEKVSTSTKKEDKKVESSSNVTLPPLTGTSGLVTSNNQAIKEVPMKNKNLSNPPLKPAPIPKTKPLLTQANEDTETMSDGDSSQEELTATEKRLPGVGMPLTWQPPGVPLVWSARASDQCVTMEREATGTQYKVTDMKDFQPLDMDKIMSRRKKSAAHSETTCSSVSTFRSSSESSLRSSSPGSTKFKNGHKIAPVCSPDSEFNDDNLV